MLVVSASASSIWLLVSIMFAFKWHNEAKAPVLLNGKAAVPPVRVRHVPQVPQSAPATRTRTRTRTRTYGPHTFLHAGQPFFTADVLLRSLTATTLSNASDLIAEPP